MIAAYGSKALLHSHILAAPKIALDVREWVPYGLV